jgi:ABC-2 type transport system ATP-binding protein
MTANNGYFELKADNNTLLLNALNELQWFTAVNQEGDILKHKFVMMLLFRLRR